jgi:molybdopterin-containing oxidoreductase family iron-sulfur binding subunit
MGMDRRDFLKYTSVASLGLAAQPIFRRLNAGQLPQESPLTAKRWAMVVDVRKCLHLDGCTKCIDACNLVHNVPNIPDKDDEIKWIWKEPFEHAFEEQEHQYLPVELRGAPLVVLCNHCENPSCVRVCPTQATWKRTQDGIVMMDWHRCIGCRYCMAACPYGSRSFNWRDPRPYIAHQQTDFPTRTKGVVEKCTFCEERLARGLLPACVTECPEKAMVFGDLDDVRSEVRQLLANNFTLRRKSELGTEPQVYYIV